MKAKAQNNLPRKLTMASMVAVAVGMSWHTSASAVCSNITTDTTLTNSSVCQNWTAGNLSVTGAGVHLSSWTTAIYASSVTGATLTNSGTISTLYYGVRLTGGSNLATVDNSGLIQGSYVFNVESSTVGNLVNSGTITGTVALYNAGTITSIANTGTLFGSSAGISNYGTISTLNNNSIIASTNVSSEGAIANRSVIGTLINNNSITGVYAAINNVTSNGTIGILTNNGTVSANIGIRNQGSITTLNNQSGGVIHGSYTAIYNNGGTISTLTNSGTISAGTYAIFNSSSSSLGAISNSGMIAGQIYNATTDNLTINGGTGSIFGTLTGSSGGIGTIDVGMITNTSSDVYFASGNQLLNSDINAGTHTVYNNGTLQVNNPVTITGSYNQGASANLIIGVTHGATSTGTTSDTGYGYLRVTGDSTIASGATVSLKNLNTYSFAQGQRFVAISTTGVATYNEGSLNYVVSGFNATGTVVNDNGNNALVVVLGSGGSSSPVSYATTDNAKSAFGGLFNYAGANANLLNVFNASAALGSTAEANRAGAQLSPTSSVVAATQASSAPTQTVLNVAGAHVDGLRTARADGISGVATGERGNQFALWGQAFGGKASQSQRNNISGYDANFNGLLIGGDKQLNDAWRLGGLVSYANTAISSNDSNSGSSTNLKSYGLIGYAGFTADNWYLDLSGGVVRHKYSTTRLIDFTNFSGVANGSHDGTQYVLSAQGGYPIRLNDTTVLTPLAGLNYSQLRQDGYTESGGNGAALTVASNKSSSFKSDLGAKLERSFVTSYGTLAPSVQLTWRHEYQNTRLRSVASFAADTSGSTSFTSEGAAPVANTGIMALAATLTRSDNITLTARYTLEAASGYRSQTADLRLRYQF